MKVNEAISLARKAAGLTQEQLASRVYVTRQAVSRWETGESEPSIDMRKMLAEVLGVPTPGMDAIITCISMATGIDYRKEGRTAEKVGLKGKSVEEIYELIR